MNTNEVLEESRHALAVMLGVMLAGMHLRDTPLGQLQPKTVAEFDQIRGWFTKINLPNSSTMHSLILNDVDFSVKARMLASICRGSITGVHRAIEQHTDFKKGTASFDPASIQARLPSYRFLWLVRNAFSHDFTLKIDNRNHISKVLPLGWRHIAVTTGDLGKTVPFKIQDMMMLLEDLIVELEKLP